MTKWQWKMDYCKKHKIPPAQTWAWDKAEEEYNNRNLPGVKQENKMHEECTECIHGHNCPGTEPNGECPGTYFFKLKSEAHYRSGSNALLSCDVADMIDRLTCMAKEKDMEAMSPMQSRLAETHKADAKCLRKCISMIVALTR